MRRRIKWSVCHHPSVPFSRKYVSREHRTLGRFSFGIWLLHVESEWFDELPASNGQAACRVKVDECIIHQPIRSAIRRRVVLKFDASAETIRNLAGPARF
jgi:hypothetical protein